MSTTIASISTAPGIGGIGIIRMSGAQTFEILEKIFKQKKPQKIEDIKGYTIKYGHIVDNEKIIDEVLVSYFKAPKSYTTENMCEINSHGGTVILKEILELCLKNGAELAEPGEFTKRAFLNGRIDLAQAESVIDIINAKSEKEAKSSINQLEGFLSRDIREIKQGILDVLVNIDVTIDYPEYDTPEVQKKEIKDMLENTINKLSRLEKSFDNGKIIKDGIKTAIIGKPNAGKSSLLNAILKEDRAIVTALAGTTRDTIEEFVQNKHNFISAIIEISDLHVLATHKISSMFTEDVKNFLKEQGIISTPHFIIEGSTKLSFTFDFLIASYDKEIVLRTFNSLNNNNVPNFLFCWEDVKGPRESLSGKELKGLVFVNDEISNPKKEFLDAIKSKGADYILWSDRHAPNNIKKISA